MLPERRACGYLLQIFLECPDRHLAMFRCQLRVALSRGDDLLVDGNDIPKTVISREYSSEWKVGDEPYYPVNDEKNGALYQEYKKLADKEQKVIFGGRLGEYKYYDMDAVIASALELVEKGLADI